jgi:hypothetical protein
MKRRPVPRNASRRSNKSSKLIAHERAYAGSRTTRWGSPMVTTGKLSASVWSRITCSHDSVPLARLPVIRTAPISWHRYHTVNSIHSSDSKTRRSAMMAPPTSLSAKISMRDVFLTTRTYPSFQFFRRCCPTSFDMGDVLPLHALQDLVIFGLYV